MLAPQHTTSLRGERRERRGRGTEEEANKKSDDSLDWKRYTHLHLHLH